jgi:hypothetical protein
MVRYHTKAQEANRKTKNSGIMTTESHKDIEEIEFYVSLRDIIELRYNSGLDRDRTVVLFQVDWYDLEGTKKEPKIRNDGYFTSVNTRDYWYQDDPYILTEQATKVFYLQDTLLQQPWRVVQKFEHRHLWSYNENEDIAPTCMVLAYQDDEIDQTMHDVILDDGLGDGSEVPVPLTSEETMVAITEVDAICQHELSDVDIFNFEDEDDDTLWKYVDEDENHADKSDDD